MRAAPAGGTVLLDLDGTLTDSREGILRSLAYALERLGHPPPEPPLDWVIGPPMQETLARFVGYDAAPAALDHYRERYASHGQFENALYPGIPEMLDRLSSAGWRLIVATSKMRGFAVTILEHFGIADRFAAIHGSEPDGTRTHKSELIGWILDQERVDPARAVMVGDRSFDVLGAAAHGIPTIGALYGFGGREELVEAGAARLAETAEQVADAVAELAGAVDRPATGQ